jgi:deoxyribodipyrimidine photo-lyase|tara:strand:- start:3538 stop:4755 length:1218 start_codon:yes stop_codon:yes gene_type:complete
MSNLLPTRAAGLLALQEFIPNMGTHYENKRNYDYGLNKHKAVSTLSFYICRRLITEKEVVCASVTAHGPDVSKKFIEEVIWRGYFKGWLERRPQVWDSYVSGLYNDCILLENNHLLRQKIERAESAQTGLDYFDEWARELLDTGYLHNHARMWFASIWIFTLGLPWRLGADFFYRHLLDGDAASNTLSWRWVAGLHTRGKPYIARAENISMFTNGRFNPLDGELADVCHGLEETEPEGLPTLLSLRDVQKPKSGVPTAVLVTDEDCQIEDFDLSGFNIKGTATLSCSHLRSSRPVSNTILSFENGALFDAAMRLNKSSIHLKANHPKTLANWAQEVGAKQVFTPFITCGPLWDWLKQAEPFLNDLNIKLCEQRREWDNAIWPYATAGFFKVKKQIPIILEKALIL